MSDAQGPARVGVVGLGAMGGLMAGALVRAGHEVGVVDLDLDAVARAEQQGCRAETLPGLAAAYDVVVLSLPHQLVVRAVLDDLLPAADRLSLVVDTSTISPEASREHARLAGDHGVRHVDAPVLGRPEAVGAWTMPLGGDDVSGVAGLLAPLTKKVVHVGGPGAGATLKVVNNQMLSVINAVTAEALTLAAAAGLAPATFVEVVVDSGAASVSGLFRDVGPRAVAGDLDPVFALELMRKDNALAVELAAATGVPVDVTAAALALHERGVAAGLGDRDSIAVVDLLAGEAGTSVRP